MDPENERVLGIVQDRRDEDSDREERPLVTDERDAVAVRRDDRHER